MPWKPSDAVKHNKHATGHHAKRWAAVANGVLRRTGDDGRAIREANAVIRGHKRKHGS